ncbi:MAG: ABC transporter permease [Clostridia bacterium]|nr:ABC transporter permease [Clostridia bacterium]
MNRTLNFCKRNLLEVLRDPIIYVFCLGFPILMFVLFFVINSYSNGQTPTFEIPSLLSGITVFSYSFVMLALALVVSKDRQTSFLKRLYSSPMKYHDFILGYFLVGLFVGIIQTVVCIVTAFIFCLTTKDKFIPVSRILLLTISFIPILTTNIFLGVLLGTLFNDKSAPGICSIFISVSGILGGCWMPVETMGGFETFCRFLPFYPSVYIGRIITNSTNALNVAYTFNGLAKLGLITIFLYMLLAITLSVVAFKKSMTSDK